MKKMVTFVAQGELAIALEKLRKEKCINLSELTRNLLEKFIKEQKA